MTKKFKDLKKEFNEMFGEFNYFDLALDAIAYGLNNGQDINHSKANLFYEGPIMSMWARAGGFRGYILWETGSNHVVRFDFIYEDYPSKWNPENFILPIELEKIQIGNDESSSFYPTIRQICRDNNIELVETEYDDLVEIEYDDLV